MKKSRDRVRVCLLVLLLLQEFLGGLSDIRLDVVPHSALLKQKPWGSVGLAVASPSLNLSLARIAGKSSRESATWGVSDMGRRRPRTYFSQNRIQVPKGKKCQRQKSESVFIFYKVFVQFCDCIQVTPKSEGRVVKDTGQADLLE